MAVLIRRLVLPGLAGQLLFVADCKDSTLSTEITIAAQWLATEHAICLAVVAKTWGSAPRKAGSLLVVKTDGTFEGSVSGGCVEGNVIAEAQALLAAKTFPSCKELSFSVSSEQAFDVGLACGGEIVIWLLAIGNQHLPDLQQAVSSLSDGVGGALAIDTAQRSLTWAPIAGVKNNSQPEKNGDTYKIALSSELKLDIVGAVHIAQHLAVMAEQCGFKTTVIDPRGAFTDNRKFGTASVSEMWPDDYFSKHPPSPSTAVVTLTHDPKLDDAALSRILNSKAFYVGSLGSKKTHAARIERLMDNGFSSDELAIIDAPIGMDIGASNPAEIAVAIMAKIVEALRKP